MAYKRDCKYFREVKSKVSEELGLTGKQPDEVYIKQVCLKNAFRSSGCPDDCPFYEKIE